MGPGPGGRAWEEAERGRPAGAGARGRPLGHRGAAEAGRNAQPFRPDSVIDRMKKRWENAKTSMIGTELITAAAITRE